MKKLLMLAVVLVFGASLAVAQTGSSGSTASTPAKTTQSTKAAKKSSKKPSKKSNKKPASTTDTPASK